ncbi:TRAP-type uncharacterized transport system [Desulfocucumis palustris]|uniref:TRAP-type uncharacterized transport system n=1 Tax=Desulfocucumis palustris TaxID=1898651 RepID=A0A2L2XHF1_9FIRM|nr:TRAP transporter permease [Desulfocucumis palustris]GBF33301.1 TRAP-type uncharacterized transport system [Desulfocucumis palustris]
MNSGDNLTENPKFLLIRKFITWFAALSVLFHIAAVSIFPVDPWVLRGAHVTLAGIVFFIGCIATKEGKIEKAWYISLILAIASLAVGLYIMFEYSELYYRLGLNPTRLDVVMGLICILVLFEMTRRLMGLALPLIAVAFILYSVYGGYLPGVFGHRGFSLSDTVSFLFSPQGIYGTAVQASASVVILFITFGAFLNVCGASNLFINLALSLTGRIRGGTAKAAIVASSLFGMVSGSAVANVATVGTFTIPLMIRGGYQNLFAGAVEAVGSTGGQLMPPIMGTSAFIMAEFLGIPYVEIALAAIIPAFLYYLAVFLQVDFEAVRLGIKGLPSSELPKFWETVKKHGYLMLPILVLMYTLLVVQSSTIRAGLFAILTTIALGVISRSSRLSPGKILNALSDGMTGIVSLAAATATAGIIVGVLTLTGLGLRVASIILSVAGDNLFLTLLLTMMISIVLGIGLPTAPSYIIAASVAAPALIKLGVPDLAAHLFVFYYAVISTITPPECHAAFSAGAIAQADPMKTGFVAFKLGLAALIVPFAFAYDSVLLLDGTVVEVALAVLTSSIGIYALARSTSYPGHNRVERLILFVAAVLLIIPGIKTFVPGLALLAVGHIRAAAGYMRARNLSN